MVFVGEGSSGRIARAISRRFRRSRARRVVWRSAWPVWVSGPSWTRRTRWIASRRIRQAAFRRRAREPGCQKRNDRGWTLSRVPCVEGRGILAHRGSRRVRPPTASAPLWFLFGENGTRAPRRAERGCGGGGSEGSWRSHPTGASCLDTGGHHPPGSFSTVAGRHHGVLRLRDVNPVCARFQIHQARSIGWCTSSQKSGASTSTRRATPSLAHGWGVVVVSPLFKASWVIRR